MSALRRLFSGPDLLIACGLLVASVVISPPPDGGARLTVALPAAVLVTGVAAHAIRNASTPGTRWARLGPWSRATAALGTSASVMMILNATLCTVG